ncbi:MAG: LysM peptidoglycan-binding domain-containing protein [Bacteroidales bacterium]|nr:LysM peptidoglycan-binding domain-containing protein [Bacteroidales bacterium]
MKKILLIPFLFLPFITINAQEKVTGTRKQMIQEILSLRKELSDLQAIIDQNNIPLSDTLTVNDTLNWGNYYTNYPGFRDEIEIPINTDSLLSIFYLQRSLHHNIPDDFMDIDNLDMVADLPDSVYISRLTALNSIITLPYNATVRNSIVFYTQRMSSERIGTILGLATYYMPIFEEIFDQHDMPLELKAVAIIESALNPVAVSRAKARGMWQFMHRTALQYDLTINSYVDERYDPIVSGHAAAKYLKDAYTIFGDWALAISSYNCGAGNVNKAIRRAGSRSFWDIYPYLPRETRGYLPAFVAALYTLTYYKEHGIKPLRIEMPTHLDTLHVSQKVHFEQIAELTGISVDELRDLNPQYIRDVIPGRPFILRLPHQYTPLFVDNEKEIYTYNENTYFNPILLAQSTSPATAARNQLVHTVRSGETLGGIALRYRVKVSDLQYWNNLKNTTIRIGQKLVIYSAQAPAPQTTTSTPTSSSTASNASSIPANSTKITHEVKSGETLGLIAQKYRVSTANLQSWNNIKGTTIRVGQKLTVYTQNAPASTNVTTTAAATASASNASFQWYTIKKGDTLWSIASNHGVSLNDLMALNGLNRDSKIIVGNRLKIKPL